MIFWKFLLGIYEYIYVYVCVWISVEYCVSELWVFCAWAVERSAVKLISRY